jgi:hypothetical protein
MSSTAVHHLPGSDHTVVTIDGNRVLVHDLVVDDPSLIELLATQEPEHHADLLRRVIAVGARGLLTMGIGIDLAAIDGRVRQTLAAVTAEAQHHVADLLAESRRAVTEQLDPEHRSSVLSRALDDFGHWRDSVIERLDPDRADSHTAAFLERLTTLLGPDGDLERRLSHALDPDADDSMLGRLDAAMDERFRELRDLIVREGGRRSGREEEAGRGTAQGLEFEDVLEERLRSIAAGLGGCTVERTSRTPGTLGPKATVGDFVVILPAGERIVVEAKNQASLTLTGRDGVLAELDRARDNREAAAAVCVSARDAFPAEVGAFGVYGDRVLAVDEGDGTMTAVALRWAIGALAARRKGADAEIDVTTLTDRVDRIRTLAERFKTARRTLTDVGKSVDAVRETLAEMRTDLLDLVDDVQRALTPSVD